MLLILFWLPLMRMLRLRILLTNECPYLYDYIDDEVMWADVEDAVNDGNAVALAKLLGITTTGDRNSS